MGGAKKTVHKMGKRHEDLKKKEAPKKEITKSTTTSIVEPKIMDQIKKDVPKMKFITPYQMLSKYNIKYSTSKDILEKMVNQGTLKLLRKTRRIEIYVPSV